MVEFNQLQILGLIKDACAEQKYIEAVFVHGNFSTGDFSPNSDLEVFILVSEEQYKDKILEIITDFSKTVNHVLNTQVWTINELSNVDNPLVQKVFKEGKLIYWNSLNDLVANRIFKVRPYTIFYFDLSKLAQNDKAKFNYQIYGKKNSGILTEMHGKRITKGCFYVPLSNKFKMARFLSKNNIEYECIECWI